jgi:hypothetical protein
MAFGRTVIGVVGTDIMVIATDFHDATWKPGGITVDWDKVTAVAGADVVLTGGTTVPIGAKYIPAGTVMNVLTGGATAGYYAPYASGGADGQQTLSRDSVILNTDLIQEAPFALTTHSNTDNVGGLQGGTVWKARLQVATVGTATKPTFTAFEAAFPDIKYAVM